MSKFFDETMQGLLEALEIKYKNNNKSKDIENITQDSLRIEIDFSFEDNDVLIVMRRNGNEHYIINMLKNDEAREIYNKLIGR